MAKPIERNSIHAKELIENASAEVTEMSRLICIHENS
jgi:hypothetical protein